jgi:hypothetical protein
MSRAIFSEGILENETIVFKTHLDWQIRQRASTGMIAFRHLDLYLVLPRLHFGFDAHQFSSIYRQLCSADRQLCTASRYLGRRSIDR